MRGKFAYAGAQMARMFLFWALAAAGCILPVSTGPNAIVYGSGCIPILKMVRHGLLLDFVGFAVIVAAVTMLG